ncbi:ABC transporter substrate-binding protein [Halomonas campisalis]|uniref:ABC transporter substrate-binding protein n=1 Tax=Billgrantia campisalis TaxID=74661 RepID=A0ABS9PC12_9GAMM|nr:CmpA/NrtA family ABC transporter substrate-binding protein [Halomonas campisalis]MCG6659312.1 ABC transporter substrate-binding protein [Halomonas campisalis]MDR5863914.1 CmpA/NrtA family ABC transporter substrate-binding protein [Halomonas campisalis]
METSQPPELPHLTLGFIPLLDAALLIIAREYGFFAEQGLEVTLSRENTWSTLRDKVAAGLLDGAQMLSPLPLAMSLGLERAPCDTLAPVTLSRNGNALVLSTALADACGAAGGTPPRASARALAAWLAEHPRRRPRLAMVYPYSCQHYLLREWLALGGLDPDRDMELVVLPPPRMVATLREGAIDGFCVGEPWGSLAEHDGVGQIVAGGADLWPDHPEKVLGVTRSWARRYPATLTALIRAVVAASQWLATAPDHQRQARDWLALPPYLDRSVGHLDDLRLNSAPLYQRLFGEGVLRPDIEAMGRVADPLARHLAGSARRLDIRTLHECYAPVHFDAAMHQ